MGNIDDKGINEIGMIMLLLAAETDGNLMIISKSDWIALANRLRKEE